MYSYISFGIGLDGSTTKITVGQILDQQKRAIRITLKLKYDGSAKVYLKNVNLLTVGLYSQYVLEVTLIAKHETINKTKFEPPNHNYNTRH